MHFLIFHEIGRFRRKSTNKSCSSYLQKQIQFYEFGSVIILAQMPMVWSYLKSSTKKEGERTGGWFTVCPLGGQCVVYTRVITVIEARLHRVSFEICSLQATSIIISNVLIGNDYNFYFTHFVWFGLFCFDQKVYVPIGEGTKMDKWITEVPPAKEYLCYLFW